MSASASEAKVALVVGNSDGIGLAFTRRLLAEGWTVVGVSRQTSAGSSTICSYTASRHEPPATSPWTSGACSESAT